MPSQKSRFFQKARKGGEEGAVPSRCHFTLQRGRLKKAALQEGHVDQALFHGAASFPNEGHPPFTR